jgi:sugar/nucleoside kinase (ribokinase family)
MSVLIAGSIAIDTVKTPVAERLNQLGGSAAYAAIASSFFAPTRLVSIIGHDFPKEHIGILTGRGIDIEGIEISEGESFRWSGEYHEDLNTRTTHDVAVNVLEHFQPKLPASYRDSQIVVLANMSPQNQMDALAQCEAPVYVIADTMDLWINLAREQLFELLTKVDMLVINDAEAKEFMRTNNLIVAGRQLRAHGPKHVVIKTGEHGALLFGEDKSEFFRCGAYPLDAVEDPTGAGDSFLGGLAGSLCALGKTEIVFDDLKNAIVHGTVMASYNCQSFSTDRLHSLTQGDIDARYAEFRKFTEF